MSSLNKYKYHLLMFFILGVFLVGVFNFYPYTEGDNAFLYNRIYQMYDCLKADIIPWFYYNDFSGVGYGSSFFYGQWTLLFFVPLARFGDTVTMFIYYIVTYTTYMLGLQYFYKRFKVNAELCAGVTFCTTGTLYVTLSSGLSAFSFGLAIGLFFLGLCIDSFRGKKWSRLYVAAMLYALIVNTNKSAAVIVLLSCFFLFCYYFDYSELKNYIKFVGICLLFNSYSIVNYLYHLSDISSISTVAESHAGGSEFSYYFIDKLFLGDTFLLIQFCENVVGYQILQLSTFFIFILGVLKLKSKKQRYCVLLVVVFMVLINIQNIWINIPILFDILQFPVRFTPYVLVLIILVVGITCKNKFIYLGLILISLFSLSTTLLFTTYTTTEVSDTDKQIVNGEFLPEDFDNNYYTENGVLDYIFDSNGVVYTPDASSYTQSTLYVEDFTGTLTFPKLYYTGYMSNLGDVYSGWSGYCSVDIEDYTGEVVITYVHPYFLQVLFFVNILLMFYFVFEEVKPTNKEYFLCTIVVVSLYSLSFLDSYVGDFYFFYNRVEQVISCLSDGNMFWYYYNDVYGIGYGSSFFYGGFTLLPFCLLHLLIPSMELLFYTYIVITCLLTALGIFKISKCFNIDFMSLLVLYFTSTLFLFMLDTAAIAMNLGVAVSMLFIYYTVRFLRDGYSFIPSSLIFMVLLDLNKPCSLLSFIICILLILYYFNSGKIKSYIFFGLYTVILCLSTLFTYWYHSDILTRMDFITSLFTRSNLYDFAIFGNYILLPQGLQYSNLITTLFTLLLYIYCYKYIKNSKKLCILYACSFLVMLLTFDIIWCYLLKVLPLQYPDRVFVFLLLFMFIMILKFTNTSISNKLIRYNFFIMLLSVLLCHASWVTDSDGNVSYNTVCSGEYMSSEFVTSEYISVLTNLGELYSGYVTIIFDVETEAYLYSTEEYVEVENDKQYCTVELDNYTGIVRFPKLWYRNFKSNAGEVYMGWSQYCEVEVENYTGELTIWYSHPIWLQFIWYFDIFIGIISCIYLYIRRRDIYKTASNRQEDLC